MKHFKKYFSILMLAIIGMSFFIPIKADANTEDKIYDRIQEDGVLRVGLSADYPPYEFHTTIDGKDTIVGIDILIAEKIAADMGVKLKIEEFGFDALLGALKTGKIDLIISGMSPTPERLQEVNFSDPYMEVKQRVVVRKGEEERFNSVNDFDGIKVGAQKQTTQEDLAKNELIGSQVVSLQKFTDIILQLQNKKIDAAVVEGPVAEAYLSQTEDLSFADNVQFADADKQTAVALSKEAPVLLERINETIATIKEENLVERYKKEASALMFNEESFFEKYASYFLKGTGFTILLAIVGVFFGAILGAILAIMKISANKLLKIIATVYIEYVRGTPLLVQIFLVFFGTNVIGLDLSALASSLIALSLNSAAYVAEIVRAGINAVDVGQMESARSLGMNKFQAMKLIIMPQAIKNILPALGNEFVTVIKESSVVSVVGVSELMFQAGVVQGASFKPFIPIVIASIIYFILTFGLSRVLGVAERRLGAND
ncbi:ABC transporter substrate-binding protein/permease [Vagococcus elongatus]|uniref:ABC transporter permease n=1 Tax=Vagococcus elongatus TaxID=180344 RepID=A0A430AZQ8_9ENTE|nr:ABC transporter permease [Vagococcus elongatus]